MYLFFFLLNIRRLDFILQLTVVVVVVGCCNSACVLYQKLLVYGFQLKNQQFSLVLFCFSFSFIMH